VCIDPVVHLRQDSRAKMQKKAVVVSFVVLRQNKPASSGQLGMAQHPLQPVPTRRFARRDGSQREPFHRLMRLPGHLRA